MTSSHVGVNEYSGEGWKPETTPKTVDISLRDWFAGQALVGLLRKNYDPDYAALYAYKCADSMIKMRQYGVE